MKIVPGATPRVAIAWGSDKIPSEIVSVIIRPPTSLF